MKANTESWRRMKSYPERDMGRVVGRILEISALQSQTHVQWQLQMPMMLEVQPWVEKWPKM